MTQDNEEVGITPSPAAREARMSPVRRHTQFTLRQLLGFTAVTAGFLSSVTWAGLFGAVLYLGLASLVSLAIAIRSRRYGVATAATIGLVACLLTLHAGSVHVTRASGRSTRPLTFTVLAADDGVPIPNATVRIRDVGRSEPPFVLVVPVPDGEPGIENRTDTEGTVTLVYTYPASWRETLFVNEGFVGFFSHWVQVSASGYEPAIFDLRDLVGNAVARERFPLPAIPIRLKRLSSNAAQPQGPTLRNPPGG